MICVRYDYQGNHVIGFFHKRVFFFNDFESAHKYRAFGLEGAIPPPHCLIVSLFVGREAYSFLIL